MKLAHLRDAPPHFGKDSPSELSIEEAQQIIELDRPLQKAGLSPAAGGYLGQKVSKPSTHVSEVVGLTAAVFILLFTFGTVGPTSPTASTDFVDRDFE